MKSEQRASRKFRQKGKKTKENEVKGKKWTMSKNSGKI
jgi:hypothetical protein